MDFYAKIIKTTPIAKITKYDFAVRVSYQIFCLKLRANISVLGDVCTNNQHDCHADADCSTTDSNAEGFTCSCKNGYTNTLHKADGELCYDKRNRFLKTKSKNNSRRSNLRWIMQENPH